MEQINSLTKLKQTHWKFYLGVTLIILQFIFGIIGKISIVELIAGGEMNWVLLSIYLGSWVMLFLGIFLVGKDTIDTIDAYIKSKVKEAYQITTNAQKRGIKNVRDVVDKARVEGKRHMTNVKNAADNAYSKMKR